MMPGIKDMEDTLQLKKDTDRFGIRARKWGMRFQMQHDAAD